jgi:hypothetical protein
MPEKNFAFQSLNENPTIAPDIGALITDAANSISAENVPAVDGVTLNVSGGD